MKREVAFAKSTATFHHGRRPAGLEKMSGSYVEEMRRRLHIRILLSRMGCATDPHQDQLSTDSCIVLLLASHAGTRGRGQWRITLLAPSYLGNGEGSDEQQAHSGEGQEKAVSRPRAAADSRSRFP
jgi:hypothetical protein